MKVNFYLNENDMVFYNCFVNVPGIKNVFVLSNVIRFDNDKIHELHFTTIDQNSDFNIKVIVKNENSENHNLYNDLYMGYEFIAEHKHFSKTLNYRASNLDDLLNFIDVFNYLYDKKMI